MKLRSTISRVCLRRILPAAATLALAAASAQAAALMPTPLVSIGDDGGAQIIPIAGGCGFGEHRGAYGGCRINNGPRGALRAATTGLPRGCPPGMHRGFYGRCRF